MPRCKCCGIPIDGPRVAIELCVVCDRCDRRHGAALEQACIAAVRAGLLSPWHALCRMMIDDALLTGGLALVVDGRGMARPLVPDCPDRWMVVICRAWARQEQPQLDDIVGAVLGRYIPGPATRANFDAIARDLQRALSTIDENVLSVEVDSKIDTLDPEHLIINIQARTPATPGMVTITAPDVELPADIMTRPRGLA